MYVPIVLDPCAFYEYRYLWEYLKYEYHCYKNNWPIVTREKYKYYREKRPISNVYDDTFCQLHQYRVLNVNEESLIKKYFISEDIFAELEKKCGSKLGVKLFLLKNRYRPLEKVIESILIQIQRDTGEKIKGILNWNAHFVSIRYVAQKMKIPVITNEFSIRFPEYYPLGYLCKSEIYCVEEIQKQYKKYMKEKHRISFPFFSRRELLALFLEEKRLHKLEQLESIKPKYEIGIAGCHPLIATFFSKTSYTDLELIEDVRKLYCEEDILFRKHPGDEPYQAEYTLKNKDSSKYASDFLVNCKRITAIGSNIIVEAMLWGRTIFSKDVSPFTCFVEKDLAKKDSDLLDDLILNFIFLGYFVPFNKMFDEDYMDWRLEEQDIVHVIEKNIRYYFKERKIPYEVLLMSEGRYEQILYYRHGGI